MFLPNQAIDLNTLSDDDFDTHIDTLTPTEAIEAISQRRGVEDADQYAHWRKAVLNKQRDAAQRKLNAKHKPFDPSRYNSYPEMKRAEALYNQQISQQHDEARATIDALDKQIADINQYQNRRNAQIAAEREAENPLRNTQQGAESTAIQSSTQPIDTTPISQDSQDTATIRPTTPQPSDTGTTRTDVVDNQGNPIDTGGNLIIEPVASIDEITDQDFETPTRTIALPTLPENVRNAIGTNGRQVIIKKNVFEKNHKNHKDLSPANSREILKQTLFNPNLYGQNQKASRPYNWILIHLADPNTAVIIEVNENKENVEIVNWHYLRGESLEMKKKQAIKEGGLILTLESAVGNTLDSSSTHKDTTSSLNNNNSEQKSAHLINEASKNDDLRTHIASWQQAINAPIVVLSDIHQVNNPQARAAIASATLSAQRFPGWFSDGTIYLYLPHCTDTTDIDRTILHECIAHYGVRKLFPSPHSLNRFYDQVWNMMQHNDRQRFLQYPGISNLTGPEARRAAADEYIAHLAEQLHTQGTTITPEQTSIWQRIVSFLRNALRQAGINLRLSDTDLNNLLISSYNNLRNNTSHPSPSTSHTTTMTHPLPSERRVEGYSPSMNNPQQATGEVGGNTTLNQQPSEKTGNTTNTTPIQPLSPSTSDTELDIFLRENRAANDRHREQWKSIPRPRDLEKAYNAGDTQAIEQWKAGWEAFLQQLIPMDLPVIDGTITTASRNKAVKMVQTPHGYKVDKESSAYKAFDYIEKSLKKRKKQLERNLSEEERRTIDIVKRGLRGELNNTRMRAKKKTAPETESVLDEHQPSVVSSADGAKVLKNLDNTINEYDKNANKRPNTIIGDIAKALGAKKHGSNSQYATFEAVNGKVFTIRLSNHNAKVSTFDNHNESEGISIVISPATNTGTINDGDAHVVEYFYDAIKLRKADGKPLVEILKSIKQSLYSGEYHDTTGLAERDEVNIPTRFRFIGERGAANLDRAEEATTRLDNLAIARSMEQAGRDERTIKLATGWERGADNLWRYEIPDTPINQDALLTKHQSGATITILAELIDDEQLFKAYPELFDMVVAFQQLPLGELGNYSPRNAMGMPANIILSEDFLSRRENPQWREEVKRMEQLPIIKQWSDAMEAEPFDMQALEDAEQQFKASPLWDEYNTLLEGKGKYPRYITGIGGESTLAHEVQHAIQDIEGFARGGNEHTADHLRDKARVWAWRNALVATEKEHPELAGTTAIEQLLIDEYTQDGLQEYIPTEEQRIKGFNLYVRGYDNEGYQAAWEQMSKIRPGDKRGTYRRLAGEVEARNVANRLNYTPEERANTLARITEDVAREDQIFISQALGNPAMGSRGIKVTPDEYAKIAHNIATYPNKVERGHVFTDNYYYLCTNISDDGNFNIIAQLPIEGNEELIRDIRQGLSMDTVIPIHGTESIAPFITQVKRRGGRIDRNIPPTQRQTRVDGRNDNIHLGQQPHTASNQRPLDRDDDTTTRFRVANQNQAIFVSNARQAVENIRQDRATPEQWLAMLQNSGGIKAGEDRWLGLSDWLKNYSPSVSRSDIGGVAESRGGSNTINRQQILDFINSNAIRIEEVHYSQFGEALIDQATRSLESELRQIGWDAMQEKYPGIEELFEYDGRELLWSENLASIGQYEDFILDNNITGANPNHNAINETREQYTTPHLTDNHEIALTIPGIEPYNQHDDVHFGDAGGGRAIAWIRFGDTTDSNGNPVLVIDEIQSKRHQDGREKGYKDTHAKEVLDNAVDAYRTATQEHDSYRNELKEKYDYGSFAGSLYDKGVQLLNSLTEEERAKLDELVTKQRKAADELDKARATARLVPDAPFDKNWHELAFKRMLRYAAENGYNHLAWTTGTQQAERYNIGNTISDIYRSYSNIIVGTQAGDIYIYFDSEGNITTGQFSGNTLAEVFGKGTAEKILNMTPGQTLSGDNLHIGGEGMKAFYDRMIPSFVSKYVKKWGSKVQDITLPEIGDNGLTMHSVEITPDMRESVMQGQTMFRSVDNYTVTEDIKRIVGISSQVNHSHYVKGTTDNGETWQLRISNHPAAFINIEDHLQDDEQMPDYFTSIVITDNPDVITRGRETLEQQRRRFNNSPDFENIELDQLIIDTRTLNSDNYQDFLDEFQEHFDLFRHTGRSYFNDDYGTRFRSITPSMADFRAIRPNESITDYAEQIILRTANYNNKLPGSHLRFRMTHRTEATVSGWINQRTDLNPTQRHAIIRYIDTLDSTAMQLATARWFTLGTIRIPDDITRVRQAMQVAHKAKVDPLTYDYPMAILNQFPNLQPSTQPINPDDLPTLNNKQSLPHGITIYNVDETPQAQQHIRDIIDTHLGTRANPWCITSAINGRLTDEARQFWKSYNAHPKRVAFRDGRIIAFFAADIPIPIWWDTQDRPHSAIPIAPLTEYNEQNNTIDTYNPDGTILNSTPAEQNENENPKTPNAPSSTNNVGTVANKREQSELVQSLPSESNLGDSHIAPLVRDTASQENTHTIADATIAHIEQIGDDYTRYIDNIAEQVSQALTPQPTDDARTLAEKAILRFRFTDDTTIRSNSSEWSDEEQSIIDNAKANGTYLLAPNGRPTNLSPRQWVQVRTRAFKEWFGDWLKQARVNKLKASKPINIVFNNQYDLNRDSAKQWMKDNIRGEYTNKDTGETIQISRVGINEVTSHGTKDDAHLISITAIPQLIEDSIFIEEIPNEKGNDKYDSYRYYVCGAKINGDDYTIKAVIGVKGDSKYYDHRLTQIEKGILIDNLNGLSNSVAENQNASNSMGKDSKLLSILQTNASKIIDENGEPKVVRHNTNNKFNIFNDAYRGSNTGDMGVYGAGFYFGNIGQTNIYGYHEMDVFLNMRNPKILPDDNIMTFFDYILENFDEPALHDIIINDAFNENRKTTLGKLINSIKEIKEADRQGEYNELISQMQAYWGKGAHDLVLERKIFDKAGAGILRQLTNFVVDNISPEKFTNGLKKAGYDGVIKDWYEYVAFSPNQIKSATDNIGTFDNRLNDIRFRSVKDGEFLNRNNLTPEEFSRLTNSIANAMDTNDHNHRMTWFTERHFDSMQRLANLISDIPGTNPDSQYSPWITQNQAKSRAQAASSLGVYLLLSSQKATAAAAATLSEST